jgi:hypothetical protein
MADTNTERIQIGASDYKGCKSKLCENWKVLYLKCPLHCHECSRSVFVDIKKLLGKWGDFWADDSKEAVKDEVFVTCLTYLCYDRRKILRDYNILSLCYYN